MRIKMIGLDLDGTLLNSKKELTPYTKEVIEEAIKQGVHVLVATGRPYTGVPKELRDFLGMRYALTSNGARVLDTEKGILLIERLLPRESARKTVEVFRKYDSLQEIYFDGQGYVDKEKIEHIEKYHHDPNMWEYVRNSRIAVEDVMELLDSKTQDLDKTQALFADMDERSAAWEELSQYEELTLVGSLKYNIEINAVGVNKGKSLVELGELLGIRREEIMAIGDGDNDIVMLQEAGVGVAMGNADDNVKNAADYVAESNDEDGAAKAIVKYVLKGGESC